jgi:hypothetical protein
LFRKFSIARFLRTREVQIQIVQEMIQCKVLENPRSADSNGSGRYSVRFLRTPEVQFQMVQEGY